MLLSCLPHSNAVVQQETQVLVHAVGCVSAVCRSSTLTLAACGAESSLLLHSSTSRACKHPPTLPAAQGQQLFIRSYELGVLLLPSLEAQYRRHRHCGFSCTAAAAPPQTSAASADSLTQPGGPAAPAAVEFWSLEGPGAQGLVGGTEAGGDVVRWVAGRVGWARSMGSAMKGAHGSQPVQREYALACDLPSL